MCGFNLFKKKKNVDQYNRRKSSHLSVFVCFWNKLNDYLFSSGVTIVRQVENATPGAGQTVTFTTVLSQPGVEGVWYKDGVPVANSTNLITYRSGQYKYLTIFRVQASDAGVYMYQVAGQSTMSYLTVSGAGKYFQYNLDLSHFLAIRIHIKT